VSPFDDFLFAEVTLPLLLHSRHRSLRREVAQAMLPPLVGSRCKHATHLSPPQRANLLVSAVMQCDTHQKKK
jgi:hypothetical protein